MGGYDPKKTLDESNQAQIVCPIFQAETSIAQCFKLRELVWCGQKPPQRQGCQACMKANKCPINNIIWDMIRKPDSDPYWSAQKKVIPLAEHDLDRIARVVVPEKLLDGYSLSEKEMLMIQRANAAAGSGFIKRQRRAAEERETIDDVVETPSRHSDEFTAAKTGDMSAAINAMIKEGTSGQP